MAEQRASMMEPPVEGLLDKVDSKFTLVTLASKRARQINSYFNQLGEGLGTIVPPQVTSVSRKPLSIALEEIYESKIKYNQIDDTDTPVLENDPTPAAGALVEETPPAPGDGEPAA
jgi:DNA-directed RNA polymerase subunit omega